MKSEHITVPSKHEERNGNAKRNGGESEEGTLDKSRIERRRDAAGEAKRSAAPLTCSGDPPVDGTRHGTARSPPPRRSSDDAGTELRGARASKVPPAVLLLPGDAPAGISGVPPGARGRGGEIAGV
ncbi:hypothetical protein NL676_025106 [Syzygium grande]|nr:hypothetical protein NL676_025106 [Syzygium grande]